LTKQEIPKLKEKIDFLEKEVNDLFHYARNHKFKDKLQKLRSIDKIYKTLKNISDQRKKYAKLTGNIEEYKIWLKEKAEKYSQMAEKLKTLL
jgi:protein subunit release factor A